MKTNFVRLGILRRRRAESCVGIGVCGAERRDHLGHWDRAGQAQAHATHVGWASGLDWILGARRGGNSRLWQGNARPGQQSGSHQRRIVISQLQRHGAPDKPAPAPVPQGAPRSAPSYKPEYAAKVAQLMATMNGNATPLDPMQQCKPMGIPRAGLGIDEHIMVVANPKAAAFMWEADPGPIYRLIYLDGRQHPTDLDTSYMGHSIGHWDGDVLVVDVVGLNDETWLGGGTQGPRNALIHSDKEHVLEHWTRTGDDLVYEATIEDPVMFTKPWVMTPEHTHLATAGDYIQPQMCVNNDRTHLVAPDPNAPGGGGE